MSLIKKIEFYKNKIFKFLDKELNNYQRIFTDYSLKKKEFFDLYKEFLMRGKAIRGTLVFLTDEIFKKEEGINLKNLYYLASFFEIMHSNLLIHDDIMDQDKYRRNKKTINFYFENKFKEYSKSPQHLGNSLAINLGDIGFFIAFDFFIKIQMDNKLRKDLFHFLNTEYIKVALAQTDDVFYSQTDFEPDLKIIKKIYLGKTARYTFNLPVMATLYLKQNPLYKSKSLNSILENLGIIFQITDDLIGFLSEETGKDKGSDIRENKKTVVRYFLFQELKNSPLKSLFGKKDLESQEIKKICNFYHQSKTKEKLNQIINQIKEETISKIKENKFPQEFNDLIINFINYLIERKK